MHAEYSFEERLSFHRSLPSHASQDFNEIVLYTACIDYYYPRVAYSHTITSKAVKHNSGC